MSQCHSKITGGLGGNSISPKREPSSRGWCFTVNNYTIDDYEKIKGWLSQCHSNNNDFKYIMGKEVGASGTPHLQGWFYGKQMTMKALQKVHRAWHLEMAKGSLQANHKYICANKDKPDADYITNVVEKDLKEKVKDTRAIEIRAKETYITLTNEQMRELRVKMGLGEETALDRLNNGYYNKIDI